MALLNLLSCLALCFLPHVVYYHATPLYCRPDSSMIIVARAEFGVLWTCVQGLALQVVTSAAKVVLLACLLPGTELARHTVWQDLAQLVVFLVDVLGLYFALTKKWAHESVSNEHRFQAIGLGWAFGDSILRRLMPMWLIGFSPEFSTDSLIDALRSNITLLHSIAFAAVGTAVFNRRVQQGTLAVILRVVLLMLALMPFLLNLVEDSKGWTGFSAVGLEASVTIFSSLICWELNANASKKHD